MACSGKEVSPTDQLKYPVQISAACIWDDQGSFLALINRGRSSNLPIKEYSTHNSTAYSIRDLLVPQIHQLGMVGSTYSFSQGRSGTVFTLSLSLSGNLNTNSVPAAKRKYPIPRHWSSPGTIPYMVINQVKYKCQYDLIMSKVIHQLVMWLVIGRQMSAAIKYQLGQSVQRKAENHVHTYMYRSDKFSHRTNLIQEILPTRQVHAK